MKFTTEEVSLYVIHVNKNLGGSMMNAKNICKIIVKEGGVLVRINFFYKKH